jgi:DNA-binding response OmpR family regulator
MTRLNGCRVLVVEDDDVTSQALCLALNDLGATVIGPAADVASALDLVERHGEIDAALLDINLGRELVYPVAEALVARDVPFIFATACPVYDMPTMFWHMLRQEKPYDMRVLADRMSALCEMRSKAVAGIAHAIRTPGAPTGLAGLGLRRRAPGHASPHQRRMLIASSSISLALESTFEFDE